MAFALNPGDAIQGIIDYGTAEGRKLYVHATSSIMPSDEGYDCTANGLYTFLRELTRRARQYGWDNTCCEVALNPANPMGPTRSLLLNHGELTLEQVREAEQAYMFGQTRAAQDTHMLYQCLMNSLSKAGKERVLVWEDQYTITNAMGEIRESGALLLKVIIRESHLDTNATSSTIRSKLASLDKYIATIGSDIIKFNQHVMMLTDGLRARGETSNDLLTNLFDAYTAASDNTFVEYITRRQERYEDGEDITPEALMNLAANKYKTLLQKGKWNAPTPEQEEIQALQAQLKNLKKAAKKAGSRRGDPKHSKGSGKSGKDKSSGKAQRKELPEWMNKAPPKAELKKSKMWQGKEWWWCHPDTGGKCDGVYRRHKPSECKGMQKKTKRNDAGEQPKEEAKKKARIAAAMAAVASEDDASLE